MLDSLDWPRLVEALVNRAATDVGRELCEAPALLTDRRDVELLLRQVTQMRGLMDDERVPLGSISDVRGQVTSCLKGEVLDGRQLLDVADTLEGLDRLHRFVTERREGAPDLDRVAARIVPLPQLQSRLAASFDRAGELSTVTYPHLAELRGRKAKLHSSITDQLGELVETETWQGALQDDYFALRNDRYVVPVKVQAKSMDLGIVHDTSGSGQTVFVEPREVVGLNNRLKMADAELRREEQAILISLCDDVAAFSTDIREGLAAAAELDAVAARARLADDLGAAEPAVGEALDLRSARHPLLALKGVDVVANDLRLGSEHQALVLSGPNAGGKTVTLKTIGLCALMVRAGMHLPCESGSTVPLFGHLHTDIGDQQSVEADLSTFSGHVLTLRRILEGLQQDGEPALVLIDEIAVGTDPQQGAALAAAVLETMLDRGALVVSTTHFAPLKALAEVDGRFVNGRMEFDADQLRPTFRMSTGNPGRSYAFDIARQLGLEEAVLDRAGQRLEPTHREVDALMASLEQERSAVRQQLGELERAQTETDQRSVRLERKLEDLEERRRQLQVEVADAFDREVDGYREVVRGIIRELQRGPSLAAAERARKRIAGGARELRGKLAGARPVPDEGEGVDWEAAEVGDMVRLLAGDREAVLAALPDRRGRVEITAGGVRLKCHRRDLGPSRRAPRKEPPPPPSSRPSGGVPGDIDAAVRTTSNTLDLRGNRVDEALDKIDRFLDEASLGGDPVVFVLHGFGTGVLRKAVRAHLAASPYVQEFRPAPDSQGGDAFTAVRL